MLVTIEGIDGSGKSTLHKALGPYLADLDPVITCEPGSTCVSEMMLCALVSSTVRGIPFLSSSITWGKIPVSAIHFMEITHTLAVVILS